MTIPSLREVKILLWTMRFEHEAYVRTRSIINRDAYILALHHWAEASRRRLKAILKKPRLRC